MNSRQCVFFFRHSLPLGVLIGRRREFAVLALRGKKASKTSFLKGTRSPLTQPTFSLPSFGRFGRIVSIFGLTLLLFGRLGFEPLKEPESLRSGQWSGRKGFVSSLLPPFSLSLLLCVWEPSSFLASAPLISQAFNFQLYDNKWLKGVGCLEINFTIIFVGVKMEMHAFLEDLERLPSSQ
jgi:hypothetical protein